MKCIFISYNSLKNKSTGGSLVGYRNLNFFKEYYKSKTDIIVFDSDDILIKSLNLYTAVFTYLRNLFNFETLSFNRIFLNKLENEISKNQIDFIFLDSSLFGTLSKRLKNKYPNIKIITYCHNVELISSWHSLKYKFSFKKLYLILFSYISEKRTCLFSDYLIGISTYDDKLLKEIYNTNYNSIVPVTINDSFSELKYTFNRPKNDKIKLLFIGSNFYPNLHGINWFIDNVLDEIDAELTIVGTGMSLLKKNYYINKKIIIYDYSEDLSGHYFDSDAVISPIFIGSGMKVKVAEALMHGKVIFGTSLSFQGYDIENADCVICETKDEFKKNILEFSQTGYTRSKFSIKSRDTFLDKYSCSNDDRYFSPIIEYLQKVSNTKSLV